jgi:hypothetical protein
LEKALVAHLGIPVPEQRGAVPIRSADLLRPVCGGLPQALFGKDALAATKESFRVFPVAVALGAFLRRQLVFAALAGGPVPEVGILEMATSLPSRMM